MPSLTHPGRVVRDAATLARVAAKASGSVALQLLLVAAGRIADWRDPDAREVRGAWRSYVRSAPADQTDPRGPESDWRPE